MVLESNIESKLTYAVKEVGGLCIKLPAFLYRGIPDRLILLPGGVVIFVELKRHEKASTKERTRFHQDKFRTWLINNHFTHVYVRGQAELDLFIHGYLR